MRYAPSVSIGLFVGVITFIIMDQIGITLETRGRVDQETKDAIGYSAALRLKREQQHKCMINVIARIKLGENVSASECDPGQVQREAEIQKEVNRLKQEQNNAR